MKNMVVLAVPFRGLKAGLVFLRVLFCQRFTTGAFTVHVPFRVLSPPKNDRRYLTVTNQLSMWGVCTPLDYTGFT